MKPLAVAVMGPTAAGKTDLAIALHQHLNADIISVDSALIYRGMDIGTAKPSAQELRRAPHRLIDICDPADTYSAADFVRDAKSAMAEIVAAGRTPLLVGGTMLYFKALLEGLSPMPPADPTIRATIESAAAERGWPAMHAELAKVDPLSAARLHPNHSQRICRALEVFRASGKPMSAWQTGGSGGVQDAYNWIQIAVAPQERSLLHQRIETRFDKMLELGFVEEVAALRGRGDLHEGMPSMRAVGYRQVWQYLSGECDLATMRERGIAATRQLAKRQLTWLRGWHGLSWVNIQGVEGKVLTSEEIFRQTLNIVEQRAI